MDIEKAFDSTWHSGLLYKLSELHFSSSLIIPFQYKIQSYGWGLTVHALRYTSTGAARFRPVRAVNCTICT